MGGGRAAPLLVWQWAQKDGCAQRTGAHARQKPTSRLNMELDLQSLFGLHVYSCTYWLRPRNSPPPAFELKYEDAIGQQR